MSNEQRDACVLWALHTHAVDAFDLVPYLGLTSPEPRSGKTRLLSLVAQTSRSPFLIASLTPAVVYRVIDKYRPTLFVDEIDALLGARRESSESQEALRGILNAGYERGLPAVRCDGPDNAIRTFDVFGPKAFAGIGLETLPQTARDRTILLPLHRKSRDEEVERFGGKRRRREIESERREIAATYLKWAQENLGAIERTEPALPRELDDRAQDIWEPLLAIAEVLGSEWPERARKAAVALSRGELRRENTSHRVRLLAALKRVWNPAMPELGTAEICSLLANDEEAPQPARSEWFNKYEAKPPRAATMYLASTLREFGVYSVQLGTEDRRHKGYVRKHLEPVWDMYLDDSSGAGSVEVAQVAQVAQEPHSSNDLSIDEVAQEVAQNPKEVAQQIPRLSDEDYIRFIGGANVAGHLTDVEARQQIRLHRALYQATGDRLALHHQRRLGLLTQDQWSTALAGAARTRDSEKSVELSPRAPAISP
jgi:hypothetical protein